MGFYLLEETSPMEAFSRGFSVALRVVCNSLESSATRAPEREKMESLIEINHPIYLLNLSLHYRPSFTKPISSFSLKSTTSSRTTKSILRASSSSSSSVPPALNSKTQKEKPILETPKPVSFLIKFTCVAIFTAALVLARFNQPSIAAPIVKPTVQSVENTETKKPMGEEEEEEDELVFFGNLNELNYDIIGVLEELMEAKVKANKYKEAVSILDQMIKIQPSNTRWLLKRAQFLNINGDYDLAKLGFEQVLEKDPLSVRAYWGLMMLASREEIDEMDIEGNYQELLQKKKKKIYQELVKRIESAIEICKKKKDVKEFKLLLAQIRISEGMYTDALKIYQELVKEEPKDSMLYFNQWYIYTLLGEEGEADIQFEKYKELLPKGHQEDACVFKENMLARRKAFSQMVEALEANETVGSKK